MEIVIGIGDYAISNNEEDTIKTHALGSCVALTAYSPDKKVLGMVHIALPDSVIDPEASEIKPGHFADTGVRVLLEKIQSEYFCNKNELIFRMYGGAECRIREDVFNIGIRNVKAVKRILTERNISCLNEDVGGNFSRTIEADVSTGDVKLFSYPMLKL